MQLIVNLTDVNDNAPHFPSLSPISIEENRGVGSIVTIVTATDADQGDNAAIIYRILSGNINGKLNLHNIYDHELNIKLRSYCMPNLNPHLADRKKAVSVNDSHLSNCDFLLYSLVNGLFLLQIKIYIASIVNSHYNHGLERKHY